MSYAEIFASLPAELQLPIARLVDTLKTDLELKRSDFEDLKSTVRDLVVAQARTEARVEELVQAQVRTETRIEELTRAQRELAQAQTRTEVRIEELAEAQARTQAQVDRAAQAVADLVQTQQRTDSALAQFQRNFDLKIGGLGARWGLQTEAAFREGMDVILQEVGFTTERFVGYDEKGDVFGHPEQIELDVVVQNGQAIVAEIKAAVDRGHVYLFNRKVTFYEQQTGRTATRKLIITPYAEGRARDVALLLGVEICTDVETLR